MELIWQQVEHACCMWMRANGYPDVRLTRFGADGGIDIESRQAVAQVKHLINLVGRPVLQMLYGTAMAFQTRGWRA